MCPYPEGNTDHERELIGSLEIHSLYYSVVIYLGIEREKLTIGSRNLFFSTFIVLPSIHMLRFAHF